MRISATVRSAPGTHDVTVDTAGRSTTLAVPGRGDDPGSVVNGGELLAAALATCFVNDLYREAAGRDVEVNGVTVTVDSQFGGPGEPAREITYAVEVDSPADPAVVEELVRATDRLAEVHGTLRAGTAVELTEVRTGSR